MLNSSFWAPLTRALIILTHRVQLTSQVHHFSIRATQNSSPLLIVFAPFRVGRGPGLQESPLLSQIEVLINVQSFRRSSIGSVLAVIWALGHSFTLQAFLEGDFYRGLRLVEQPELLMHEVLLQLVQDLRVVHMAALRFLRNLWNRPKCGIRIKGGVFSRVTHFSIASNVYRQVALGPIVSFLVE